MVGSYEGGQEKAAVRWDLRRVRFEAWLYRRYLPLALAWGEPAQTCRYCSVWVFVTTFAAFFAVTGQSGAENADRTRNLDKETFAKLVIGQLVSPEEKHVKRRMKDINIAVLGNARPGTIEYFTDIADRYSQLMSHDIFVQKIEPTKIESKELADQFVQVIPRYVPAREFELGEPDTFMIFVDDIFQFLSNEKIQAVLLSRGRDLNVSKLSANSGCQAFHFSTQREVTETITVPLSSMDNKQTGICIFFSFLPSLGFASRWMNNLKTFREDELSSMDSMRLSDAAKLSVKFLYSDAINPDDTAEDIRRAVAKMNDHEFANFIKTR